MLQRNILPLSSGSKTKPSNKPEKAERKKFLAGFLIGLLFDPKDGGGRFF
jgi:hypothetical protein